MFSADWFFFSIKRKVIEINENDQRLLFILWTSQLAAVDAQLNPISLVLRRLSSNRVGKLKMNCSLNNNFRESTHYAYSVAPQLLLILRPTHSGRSIQHNWMAITSWRRFFLDWIECVFVCEISRESCERTAEPSKMLSNYLQWIVRLVHSRCTTHMVCRRTHCCFCLACESSITWSFKGVRIAAPKVQESRNFPFANSAHCWRNNNQNSVTTQHEENASVSQSPKLISAFPFG